MTNQQPVALNVATEKQSIDECQHNEVLRMEIADGSHDWQCVNCGAFFVLTSEPLKLATA